MKKITVILSVLLLCCIVFVGAGAAFTVKDAAVITPSGSLNPSQTVTGTVTISITAGTITSADRITLSTPLDDDSWTIAVFKGNYKKSDTATAVPVNTLTSTTLYGFDIGYASDDTTLVITMNGKVATSSAGQDINVISITETSQESSGVTSYSSPKQKVYNPAAVSKDIADLDTRVANLESRITAYTNGNYSLDLTAPIATLEQAKTKISAAKSAGTTNLVTAYANIEAADTLITTAEKSFALIGLKAVKANTEAIDAAIVTLYDKGMNAEAKLLDTKNSGLKNSYDRYAATYNAGGIPAASEQDTLVKDSYTVLGEANGYLDTAANAGLDIGKILPFVIIGAVVILVIAGIVFIIKRRGRSWDELG